MSVPGIMRRANYVTWSGRPGPACRARNARALHSQAGTTTAEYAIGTLAACGFAALLYKIVTSQQVAGLLSGIIHKALGSVG